MVTTPTSFKHFPTVKTTWIVVGLSFLSLLVGPFLGFGILGLLLALAAIVYGAVVYRHGERSWVLWLSIAIAAGVAAYFPFMPHGYPYTGGLQ